MARGGSRGRRTYVRDGNGRFASTPGGGTAKRPAAKRVSRGANRLTRDNSGRITGQGGSGATARGGRLRTGAGKLRATQTDRLKRAPLQGVVSRAGKARGGKVAPKVHPRIANRSAADQAHRDKIAKQWKTVEKPARRAVASMRATRKAGAELVPAYPRLTKARRIGGHSRFLRENVMDQVNLLMRSPSRGKNKLTPQQRAQAVSDAVYTARILRARAAMTEPRRRTREIRAARPSGTIAKPKPSRKAKSREMSLEQFAYQTKGKTRADTMSFAIEVSRQPHGRTKAGDRRHEARYRELDAQVKATEAAYRRAIASGKIKPPSDSLERKAQGHPDNPAVQAAKRLLEKRKKLRAKQGLL